MNACRYIDRFTRFAGEVFGCLIGILFIQVAVKGLILQYTSNPWTPLTLVNALWATLLALFLSITALFSRQARHWRYFTSVLRGIMADYGVPIFICIFTALSFALTDVERVETPNAWDVDAWSCFSTVYSMHLVEGKYIAAAILPALIMAMLFYFDHSVSAQLAQSPDFNLVKSSAYSWDLAVLGMMTIVLGLLGLPPINGVIPQSPLHTRSLSKIQKDKLVVMETRWVNFLQSCLLLITLAAMPVIRLIPLGVIWGYFLYLGLESISSTQLWERVLYLLTDPGKRHLVHDYADCLKSVEYRDLLKFTLIQVLFVFGIWAFTFAGIAGIAFPIFIILLVPFRSYLMPRFFSEDVLHKLDAVDVVSREPIEEFDAVDEDERMGHIFHGLEPVHLAPHDT